MNNFTCSSCKSEDHNVKYFSFVFCKLKKYKHIDGGYGLHYEITKIEKTGSYLNQYYYSFNRQQIVRIENKFYAVIEKGEETGSHSKINDWHVKLLPINISKFAGELIIGDLDHD